MNVFISYSAEDLELVKWIGNQIKPHAAVYYWDNSKQPGSEAWPMIYSWIDQSDLVLAVITDSAVSRAMSVGQEIGRAKAKLKTVIPVVTSNVPSTELGCLSGTTYQKIDPENPGVALNAIKRVILAKKQTLENQKNMLFLVGGVVLTLLLLSSSE